MRVLLIASYTINMMPYSKVYLDILDELEIEYDIIEWDRFNNHELVKNGNVYTLGERCSLGGGKLKKLLPYMKLRNIIIKLMQTIKYDRIIVFNTLPAIFIMDYLIRYFDKRFIYDYRDYSYEKYSFYKIIVNHIVKRSYATIISSQGFFRFIEKADNIFVSHNISNTDKGKEDSVNLKKDSVCIGFAGLIRYGKENTVLINNLRENPRYKLLYVGRKYVDSKLEEYCLENNITNVEFRGEFKNEDKPEIYAEIDIINAMYGNETYEVTTALPNKLYDCLIFKKPMLVSNNTYLAEIVEEYNLGIAVDCDDDILRRIDDYVNGFDKALFLEGAEKLLRQVEVDMKNNRNIIVNFLSI